MNQRTDMLLAIGLGAALANLPKAEAAAPPPRPSEIPPERLTPRQAKKLAKRSRREAKARRATTETTAP